MQQQEQQWTAKHKDLVKLWAARSAPCLAFCLDPPCTYLPAASALISHNKSCERLDHMRVFNIDYAC